MRKVENKLKFFHFSFLGYGHNGKQAPLHTRSETKADGAGSASPTLPPLCLEHRKNVQSMDYTVYQTLWRQAASARDGCQGNQSFLSHLTTTEKVSAATQRQALNARAASL